MIKKKRRAWLPLRKRHRSGVSGFFILLGVTASLLVASFVLQRSFEPRRSISEPLPTSPDLDALLPAGATKTAEPLVLHDLPQPSYAVGYTGAQGPALALIVWDRDTNRYVLGSSVVLASTGGAIGGVKKLELQPLGSGATSVILVQGPSAENRDGVFVAARDGRTLRLVALSNEADMASSAFFARGTSARHSDDLVFQDLDADGRLEAVSSSKDMAADGSVTASHVAVYRWVDGWLLYDKELSWAVGVSAEIFPEPQTR